LGAVDDGKQDEESRKEVESYSATGIDNALDLLEVVTAKMDKASVGQQAAGIERHPEVCFFYYFLSISFYRIFIDVGRIFFSVYLPM